MSSLGLKDKPKEHRLNTLKQGQVYKSYLKEETFFKNEKVLTNTFTQADS